ncbi:MAG: hypothetical protein M3Z66_02885 [Chloroflexota bacterium]|nr:hypothetical protein [Chloroflexota bacterium]
MSEVQRATGSHRRGGAWTGGVQGNQRLIALTGLVLLTLLIVEVLTVPLRVRTLLSLHTFVGLMLVPPVLLKLAGTIYRFARYYTGDAAYRAAGPPALPLRLMGPFLVLSTVGLFGSGGILLLAGPSVSSVWRPIHAAFFYVWLVFMVVHISVYLPRTYTWEVQDLRGAHAGGAGGRRGSIARHELVAGSVLLGVALAIAAIPWNGAWLHVLHASRIHAIANPALHLALVAVPGTVVGFAA